MNHTVEMQMFVCLKRTVEISTKVLRLLGCEPSLCLSLAYTANSSKKIIEFLHHHIIFNAAFRIFTRSRMRAKDEGH